MPLEDGEYRFKSAAPAGGHNYLAVRSSGQVFGATLDAHSDDQKWRIAKRPDGHFDVSSVGTKSLLRVNPPSKGDIAYTLNVHGAKDVPWDLEEYHGYIIFKCTGKYTPNVMDLNTRDRVVLWDRSDQPNQLWIAENIAGGYTPTPTPLPTRTAEPASTSAKVKPHWETVHGADIPPNAIQCGWEATGEPLYLAYVHSPEPEDDYVNLGVAGLHLPGICRVAYCEGEDLKIFSTYELLVGDPGTYKWVLTAGNKLRASGFWAENRARLKPIFAPKSTLVVRGYKKGAVFPGYTGVNGGGGASIENGDSWDIGSSTCEVLCYAD